MKMTLYIQKQKTLIVFRLGFTEMLDVTSRLRKAQEEDAELAAKTAQQRAALQQAEAKAEDARRRLAILRQGTASATTAGAVLAQLQREVCVLLWVSSICTGEGGGRRGEQAHIAVQEPPHMKPTG